jgi:hypothetical protein
VKLENKGGFNLQEFWRELWQQIDNQQQSYVSEAELRLQGLCSSPTSEVAYSKLGKYLQEGWRLRNVSMLTDALVAILVSAEFYWRERRCTRAAGLLLEASDLFYLLDKGATSQRCITNSLHLAVQGQPTQWWEFDIMASALLFSTCLSLIENPEILTRQFRALRASVPKRIQKRLGREDAYRVTLFLRRATRLHTLTPLAALDTISTLRSSSEFSTLYDYLTGHAERYALIRDGLTALRRIAQT